MTLIKFTPAVPGADIHPGYGDVAIVTGWLADGIEKFKSKLSEESYGVIGSFYNAKTGLSILLRNLLANPQIRHMILVAATDQDHAAKSCVILRDFFVHGFREGLDEAGKVCWIVNSPAGTGTIDREIDAESLELLRQKISWELWQKNEYFSMADCLRKAINAASGRKRKSPYGEPRFFPLPPKPKMVTLPGSLFGHSVEGKTVAETWLKILTRIHKYGRVRPNTHRGEWQELLGLQAIVTDEPRVPAIPDPNYLPCDLDYLKDYIPTVTTDRDAVGVRYTYGQRIRSYFGVDQVQQVIGKLALEPDAASATINLWDVKDHNKGGSPCLNHCWFRIQDNKLHLAALFRSNDMFTAWPSNAYALRALQFQVLDEINSKGAEWEIGTLLTTSLSAHIYDHSWPYLETLLKTEYRKLWEREARGFHDPAGNFVISIAIEDSIVVTQTTPAGTSINQWSGTRAHALCRQIAFDIPALGIEHALYLGRELQRAESAFLNGTKYRQA